MGRQQFIEPLLVFRREFGRRWRLRVIQPAGIGAAFIHFLHNGAQIDDNIWIGVEYGNRKAGQPFLELNSPHAIFCSFNGTCCSSAQPVTNSITQI